MTNVEKSHLATDFVSQRGELPQAFTDRERIYVVQQDDLKLLVKLYAAYQASRGWRPPVIVATLDEALARLRRDCGGIRSAERCRHTLEVDYAVRGAAQYSTVPHSRTQDLAVDTDQGWNEVPHRIRCGRALGEPVGEPVRAAAALVDRGRPARPVARWTHRHRTRPFDTTSTARKGIAHLHRLRALVDAVVVGVGTVRADDPQLTVRHVAGPIRCAW